MEATWMMPRPMVFHIYILDLPLLITRLEYRLVIGMNAPPTQSNCRMEALDAHLSVILIVISSGAMSDSPNMAGKETNAVKRSILRNTRCCRSLSSDKLERTGCATLFTMPDTREYPI